MVECRYCKNEYKVITPLHLKKHNTTIKEYMKKFPDVMVRDPYNCEVCGKLVTKGTSSKSKYCPPCAEEVNRQNVLFNVRKYNRKRKRFIQQRISEANFQYGIDFDDPNSTSRQTRIDNTHSGWDYIPGAMNTLGTITESDLKVKNGRIRGALWLEKEMNKIKEARKKNGRRSS